MYKEMTICVIVIIAIVIGDVITQNNTSKIVNAMTENLNILQGELIKENESKETVKEKNVGEETKNESKIKEKMGEIEKVWEERYETMAYYIEHDELEKVKTELTKLRANIETKEYAVAVEDLANCSFILEHIKDKLLLQIVNLF